MIGGLVVSHNLLAKGILSSCDMIFGNHDNCDELCLTEGIDSFKRELYKKLDDLLEKYDYVIAFADLKGGTPYNQLLEYKLKKNVNNLEIIVGVNLPMLIEFLSNKTFTNSFSEYCIGLISAGKNNIELVNLIDDESENSDDILD